jgi:DNA replicative helicase MCM subunit Mcm2 (Cdc46/Mcm family)
MLRDCLKPTIREVVEEILTPTQQHIDRVDLDVEELQDKIDQQTSKVDKDLKQANRRIRDLERQLRSNNLRISGLIPVPPQPDQDPVKSLKQRYSTSLMNLLNEAGIPDIQLSDIADITTIRSGLNNSTAVNPLTIMVKFTSEQTRNTILSQRKKFKDCTHKIFVNEDLTPHDAKIFKKTRDQVKEGLLCACWTKQGTVWAKASMEGKPFPIYEL